MTKLLRALPCVCLLAAPSVRSAEAPGILPLREVKAGMVGVGRTVFEQDRLEEFEVQVLGVLENTTPRGSTIVARLKGGPLAEAGVIAGMSGSPVYIDGRLVGAVSSGYIFSKEPIAGITPIEEMLAIPRKDWGGDRTGILYLTAEELSERIGRLEAGDVPSPLERFRSRAGRRGGAPALPVLLAGFQPAAYQEAARLFEAFGLVPLEAVGVARGAEVGETLRPGGPVAVELVRGDLSIAAFGTVTSLQGDEVLAFGHPLFNVGSVRLPMATSGVVAVLPSLMNSFKISTLGRTVGAFEQDRATGVLGKLGAEAPLVPVVLGVQRGSNPVESFRFEVATHRLLTPVLVELALLNSFQSTEKVAGAATIEIYGQVAVEGHEPVELDHFFSGDAAGGEVARTLGTVTDVLLNNEFSPATLKGVTVTATYLEDKRYAAVERVWTPRTRVRAGESLDLKVYLRHARDGEEVLALRLDIPPGIPPGPLDLLVGDSQSLARVEARSERYAPRSLGQLIRLINDLRKSSSVYVQLSRPGAGVTLKGYKLPALPPSALALLATRSTESLSPMRRVQLLETALPTSYQVSGLKALRLLVEGEAE